MNKIYYNAYTNFRDFGLAIYKIDFIKEARPGSNFILGMPELIWHFGKIDTDSKSRPTFYNSCYLQKDLQEAIAKLYIQIDKLVDILKERHDGHLENIKIAEELLKEEKQLALDSGKELKRVSNSIKNLNVEKQLERMGLL